MGLEPVAPKTGSPCCRPSRRRLRAARSTPVACFLTLLSAPPCDRKGERPGEQSLGVPVSPTQRWVLGFLASLGPGPPTKVSPLTCAATPSRVKWTGRGREGRRAAPRPLRALGGGNLGAPQVHPTLPRAISGLGTGIIRF